MLNRRTISCLSALLIAVALVARSIGTAAPPAERKVMTFLERLKPGQPVSLTERDGRFEIGLFPPSFQPLGHTVVDVGPDYVVLRDLVGISDTIVPLYSIKAIKVLRVGGKQSPDVVTP